MVAEQIRVTGTTGVLDYKNLVTDVTEETAQDAKVIPLVPSPTPQRGVRELRWFHNNRNIVANYCGLWIAILGENVIASEPTFEQVHERVLDQGLTDALIVQVPNDVAEWDNLLA